MSGVYTTATEVANEIKARLATISVAGGFNTDIGGTVFQGKVAITDPDVPCVSVIEGQDEAEHNTGRSSLVLVEQQYALVGYAKCDPADPNATAHKIIRDIKRVIFRAKDASFGGKVRSVQYLGRGIGPRADGAPIVMAVVEIAVVYVEDLSAP